MQKPSTPTTRYAVLEKKPRTSDGYPQRIEIWEAVKRLGSANRSELLRELQRGPNPHKRPKGAVVDEAYCRIELTDMTKRGFLRRVED